MIQYSLYNEISFKKNIFDFSGIFAVQLKIDSSDSTVVVRCQAENTPFDTVVSKAPESITLEGLEVKIFEKCLMLKCTILGHNIFYKLLNSFLYLS